MILINADREDFQYDIHSLIKAFYPSEDVVFQLPERADVSEVTRTIDVQIPDLRAGRRAAKDALKQELYLRLKEETGHGLPWGSLTGIRPTKIPMQMLAEGRSEEEIYAHMRTTYFCSDEKIALAIDIARRGREILSNLDLRDGYSLYIGIPFCPSTCLYCSFTSYPVNMYRAKIDAYLDALEREIDDTAALFRNRRLQTVYVGGGTPTSLEPAQLRRLIKKVKSSFNPEFLREFTVEAGRPDSITEEKLSVLLDCGVDRISVNPQTFSQRTLDLIGRHHTVEETIEKFRLARKLGFQNINMDLILGLPGEDIEDVEHTMQVIKELAPDDVTVHSLAIKRASRLKLEMEEYRRYQMVNTGEQMRIAEEGCRAIGRFPYYLYRQKNMAGNFENVGYAAEGRAGLYNVLIMEEVQDIAALGAGTVSKRLFPGGRIERCDTVKDLDQYLARLPEMIARRRAMFTKDAEDSAPATPT